MASAVALGFDISVFPGLDKLWSWKGGNSGGIYPATVPSVFSFCGYYLQAPCHPHSRWLGNWDALTDMGWGLAVVYVGQQDKAAKCCNQNTLTTAQGILDAQDACKAALADGIPAGSLIYLDVERVDTVTPTSPLTEYLTAWVSQMFTLGQYVPALYCHVHNATILWGAFLRAAPQPLAPASSGGPALWVSGGVQRYPFSSQASAVTSSSFPGVTAVDYQCPSPTDSGALAASIWQVQLDTAQSWGGVSLSIDINVSTLADPSGVLLNSGKYSSPIPATLTDFRPAGQRMDPSSV